MVGTRSIIFLGVAAVTYTENPPNAGIDFVVAFFEEAPIEVS